MGEMGEEEEASFTSTDQSGRVMVPGRLLGRFQGGGRKVVSPPDLIEDVDEDRFSRETSLSCVRASAGVPSFWPEGSSDE